MIIIGVDFHPEYQEIASVNTDSGEYQEKRLAHPKEAEEFYRSLSCGKRRKARTAPEMKQRRHTLPCGVRNSLQKQVGNDNFVADRTFRR